MTSRPGSNSKPNKFGGLYSGHVPIVKAPPPEPEKPKGHIVFGHYQEHKKIAENKPESVKGDPTKREPTKRILTPKNPMNQETATDAPTCPVVEMPLPIISTEQSVVYKRNTPPKNMTTAPTPHAQETVSKSMATTPTKVPEPPTMQFYLPDFGNEPDPPPGCLIDFMMNSTLDLHVDKTSIIYNHIIVPHTLTVIQGPPGSGKSYCINQAVRAMNATYHPCTTFEEINAVNDMIRDGLVDMYVKHVVHVDLGDFTFQLTNSSPQKSIRHLLKTMMSRFFNKYVDPNPKKKRVIKRKATDTLDTEEPPTKTARGQNKAPVVMRLTEDDVNRNISELKKANTRKKGVKAPIDRLVSARSSSVHIANDSLPISMVITCYDKYEPSLWESIRDIPHATVYIQPLRKSDRVLFFKEAAKFFSTPPPGLHACTQDSVDDLSSCLVQLEAGLYSDELYMTAYTDTSLGLKQVLNKLMTPTPPSAADTTARLCYLTTEYYDVWDNQAEQPDRVITQLWRHYLDAFPQVAFDKRYKTTWKPGLEFAPVTESLSYWASAFEQDQPFKPPGELSSTASFAYQFFLTLFFNLRQVPRTWDSNAYHDLAQGLPYVPDALRTCSLSWNDHQDLMIPLGPVYDRIGQAIRLYSSEDDKEEIYESYNKFEDLDLIANSTQKQRNKGIGEKIQQRRTAAKIISHFSLLAENSQATDSVRELPDADTD